MPATTRKATLAAAVRVNVTSKDDVVAQNREVWLLLPRGGRETFFTNEHFF